MLLIIHITVALLGIGLSTLSAFKPSESRIKVSYSLVLATILSGTALILKEHLAILSVCLSGLLYVVFTLSMLVLASRRLSKQGQVSE